MTDHLQNISPEEKLLLSLCRLDFTESEKSHISDLMKSVTDWNYFVRMANEHGIIALCWYNITETGNSSFIPTHQLEALHIGYLKSLARNTKIYSLLDEVIRLSEKAGIKVVLHKGLALEKTVYGNRGLRQMNDLDILVKREDAIRLRKILLKNGFESMPMVSPLHEKILPNYGKHLPEMYKNGLTVEIHFNLFDSNGRKLTEMFIEQSKDKIVVLENTFMPSQTLHFLYLIKHLNFHEKTGTSQLRLYTDLVLTYLKYPGELKNETLFNFAEEAGFEPVLTEKLEILRRFFDLNVSIPKTRIAGVPVQNQAAEIFIRYLQNPSMESEEPSESLLKPLSDLPGVYDKGLYIVGNIFPSLTFMKFRYRTRSKALAILYYPVRWIKFLSIMFSGKI